MPLFVAAAMVAMPPLQVGDAFPPLTGQTLSGATAEIPQAGTSSVRVLVFSFSESGGRDARLWSERLNEDFGPLTEVSRSSVIVLESVPKLFRGMVVSNIKSNVPKPLWEKTIVVFKDEALWKSRLDFSTDTHCYVVLLDKAGRVAWIRSGPFSEKVYAGLKWEVMRLIRTGKQESI
jgi:hypothetical protein